MGNNFQLYRTNTLLGGQIKWDLVLDSNNDGLYISDFHLTPVSDFIPFAKKSQENLLVNKHLENLKNYYNELKSNFYAEGSNPKHKTNTPYIFKDLSNSNKSSLFDLHDSTGEMGLKRTQYYSVYNKPVEFFCPIWLENYDPANDKLVFTFKYMQGDYTQISKAVTLDANSSIEPYHKKFVQYFNDYIKSIQLDENLLYFDLNTLKSSLSGINVKTGTYISKKNITSRLISLLQSEKLLMDSDNIITSSFKNYEMICRQLFNFNFIFDYEDIFNRVVLSKLYSHPINLRVDVSIIHSDGIEEKLPIKDFYTNYECIQDKHGENMMDDVCDYDNIDIILKNKYVPNIIHWSVDDNNDYIFNMYTGFANTDTMDVFSSAAGQDWCESIKYDQILDVHDIQSKTGEYINNGIYTVLGGAWLNKIKFSTTLDNPIKILMHVYSNVTQQNIEKESSSSDTSKLDISKIAVNIGNNTYFYYVHIVWDDDKINMIHLYVPSNLLDKLNFTVFKNSLANALNQDPENNDGCGFSNSDTNTAIRLLTDWAKLIIYPKIFELKTLGYTFIEGPAPCQEKRHYLRTDSTKTIARYGGALKPCWVDPELNNVYYKDSFDSKNSYQRSNYNLYADKGYNKLYPSINYCSIKSHKVEKKDGIYNYNLPIHSTNDNMLYITPYEYKWYDNGRSLLLENELTFKYNKDIYYDGSLVYDINEDIKEFVTESLMSKYNINKDFAKYILNQYSLIYDWSYIINSKDINIRTYEFIVKLKLK